MGRGRAVEKTEREVGWGRKGLGGRGWGGWWVTVTS